MKIIVKIDQPDAVLDAIATYAEEAAEELIARKGRDVLGKEGLSEADIERAEWAARERAEALLATWWGDDGVCHLEFDFEAGTARILRRDGQGFDDAERLLAGICDGLREMEGHEWPICQDEPAAEAIRKAVKERGKTWGTRGHEVPDAV